MGDPWVRVYGLEDGEERELYKGHHGPVHCVMYSPDGEMYASGSGAFLRPARLFASTFTSSKLLTRSPSFFRGWDYPFVADKPREIVRLVARPAQRRLDRMSTHSRRPYPLEDVPDPFVYFTPYCFARSCFDPRLSSFSLEIEQDGILLIFRS
jgi:WD40 repeat protein